MRSVQLTPYLRDVLKTLRKKNNVRGDVLSKQINKGAAYISQIESGKVKEINIDVLTTIFQNITNVSDQNFPNFIIDLIDHLISAHDLKTFESEDWIQMYDFEYRLYSIPDYLTRYLEKTLQEYGITSEKLIQRMNKQKIRGWHNAPYNKVLYPINFNFINPRSSSEFYYVRFKLPTDYLDSVMYNSQKINYAFMAGILYYIYIDSTFENICLQKCHSLLYDAGFFTVCERYDKSMFQKDLDNYIYNTSNYNTHKDTYHEFDPTEVFYNSFSEHSELQYSPLLKQIAQFFDMLYTKNPSLALTTLNSIYTNLNNDPGLSCALISSPIHTIPISLKKDFWAEYQALINKYISKSEDK